MLQLQKLVASAEWVDSRTVVTQCGKMLVLPSAEPIRRRLAPTVWVKAVAQCSGGLETTSVDLVATIDISAGTELCLGHEPFPVMRQPDRSKPIV
eukprot:COSAG01_NODE_7020_length_3389_cov_17.973252_3_plen_95_part_00